MISEIAGRRVRIRGRQLFAFLAILVLVIGPKAARGQVPPSDAIKVDVNLIVLSVTVMDDSGRPFTGLQEENFRVLDNGVEQYVHHFATEDARRQHVRQT